MNGWIARSGQKTDELSGRTTAMKENTGEDGKSLEINPTPPGTISLRGGSFRDYSPSQVPPALDFSSSAE
jgi:hypothetical protein